MEKLKLSSSKAQILIASHSMVSSKTLLPDSAKTMIVSTKAMSALPKLDSLNSEIKIENTKESDIIISPEKKRFIKISSKYIPDLDVETVNPVELKALIKSLTSKQNILNLQNQALNQDIENYQSLLFEEKKHHEELNEIQSKEIDKLQKLCRELTIELTDYKKTNQNEQQVFTPLETEKKTLKKKTPDDSPDSMSSKLELDDFCPKWPKGEDNFAQNSEHWQFQFKKSELEKKNKIIQINIDLKNNSPCLLLIEDIRISSSESKFFQEIVINI